MGLVVTALTGATATVALWQAGYGAFVWSAAPAVAHPVWLGVGDAVGIVAVVIGSLSLGALALRYAGSMRSRHSG